MARAGMEGNIMNKGGGPALGLKISCKLSERGCDVALMFFAACSRTCLTCRFMGSTDEEVGGVGYWR